MAVGNNYFPKYEEESIGFPEINESIEKDIVIVGGGLTGLIAAYYLSKLDRKVTVIEKNRIGMSSTSISTSIMQYELEDTAYDLKSMYTQQEIFDFYNFGLTGLNEFSKLLDDTKVDCDFTKRLSLLYTNNKSDMNKIEFEHEFRQNNGFNSKLIDDKNDFLCFSIKKGIICDNNSAHINPYKFATGLAKYLINEKNVEIYENSEVKNWKREKYLYKLEINDREIFAKDLVVCIGYDISVFSKKEYGTLYTTYNIVTSILSRQSWQDKIMIKSTDKPYFYGRDTSDRRVILGGCDKANLPLIKSNHERAFKQLEKEIKTLINEPFLVQYKYYGAFRTTKNNLPYIGQDKETKIYYSLCYGGNGIVFATMGGKTLMDIFNGETNYFSKYVDLDRR